jgi:LysM repeat protein
MSERNPRPQESASKLPDITLGVLIALILALLYVGAQYLSSSGQNKNDVTNGKSDVSTEALNAKEETPKNPEKPKTDTKEKTEDTEASAKKEPVEEVKIPDGEDYTHTAATGETFNGIANRYNLKWKTLKALNPSLSPETGLKVGVTTLKIRIKTVHTVGPGDVLRVVAGKYKISKRLLMKANKKQKDIAERGEKLIIPVLDQDKE